MLKEVSRFSQILLFGSVWNLFISLLMKLFSLMHLSGVATKCITLTTLPYKCHVYSCFDIMDALRVKCYVGLVASKSLGVSEV